MLTDKLINILVSKTDAAISFDKIHIHPFNTVLLKNVLVLDDCPDMPRDSQARENYVPSDTLMQAEYVIAKLPIKQFLTRKPGESIHIAEATLKNGFFNLVLEDNMTNVERIFNIPQKNPNEPRDTVSDVFDISKITVKDFGFSMKTPNPKDKGKHTDRHGNPIIIDKSQSIDWNDLDLDDVNAKISNMRFSKGIMYGIVHEMSFREKSGYICYNLAGDTRVGNGLTLIKNLNIRDPWSDVHLKEYTMRYTDITAFKDFLNRVYIGGTFKPSHLSFKTIGYFAPSIKYVDFDIDIDQGTVNGPVEDLYIKDLRFNSPSDKFYADLSVRLTNVTDIDKMKLGINIQRISSTTGGIGSFIKHWAPESQIDLNQYAKDKVFNISGIGDGLLQDLNLNLDIKSQIGNAIADINLKNIANSDKPLGIAGNLNTDNLNLGQILSIDQIGECTIDTRLKASLMKGEAPEVSIDTLKIDRLRFNGYDYHGITAKGKLSDNIFDGGIVCNEPNLSFLLAGAFAISSKTSNSVYKFMGNIGHIDLQALNLDKRGTSKASCSIAANFNWIKKQDIIGSLNINGLVLENNEGRHNIGDINISSHSSNDRSRMVFKSRFAEGLFTGTGSFISFINDLSDMAVKEELPALYENARPKWSGNNYKLSFKFNNTLALMGFILPGAYIADGTGLTMSIDKSGILSAQLKSQRIAYNNGSSETYLKNLDCIFNNENEIIQTTLASSELKAAGISLQNTLLRLAADDNNFSVDYEFTNPDKAYFGNAKLNASGLVSRDKNGKIACHIDILPSEMMINSGRWNMSPSAIDINSDNISIKNFNLGSGTQALTANGNIAFHASDTLHLSLNNINIDLVDKLMEKPLGLGGRLSGNANVISRPKNAGINLDAFCADTEMGGKLIGDLKLNCQWNPKFNIFDIKAKTYLAGTTPLNAIARYTPAINELEATAILQNMEIGIISPLMNGIFDDFEGKISGKITANGPLNQLKLDSEDLYLSKGLMTINYTKVPYRLNGPLSINEYGLMFHDIDVTDGKNGKGTIKGSLYYDHFNDMGLNLSATLQNIHCLNLTETDNEFIYGDLNASGDLSLNGPLNSLLLDVNATTSGNGNLHIPINSSATAGSTNLLKFKQPITDTIIDPYEMMMSRLKKKRLLNNDFAVKIKANATPQVTAFIEIDKASGNVLTGNGEGTLDLDIRKDLFDIKGDYVISNGNYKFVALGLASRDFSIKEGSSIKFNGNIMESMLNIDATYRTKTSLSTLISDTSSVNTRKIVDCGINITDKLSNPRLKFSIDVPDIDPTIQAKVKNALSTDDKIQKQFLSLIISNSFLPDEQSGIVNNSAVLYSNVTEIMSNQLNNILQKLNIPVDLGLDYQPNEKGKDIFDVAVSTQLFNNRVVVNGNLGNRQYSNSSAGEGNADVAGDLDIEIKLDRSGALRLNLFSHSADQYTNYLDNSQRNGVGLTYQKEFNKFGQFLKDMFKSRKRKEREELENINKEIPMKTIKIEKEDKKVRNKKNKKKDKTTE